MTDAERRASEARRLLNEPLLVEAFDKLESRLTEQLLALPTWRGEKQRRALIDRINAIRDLRAELETVIVIGDQLARNKTTFA